jgi:hypothetical protein
MSEEIKKEENEAEGTNHTKESLEAVGQIILGEIEKVGGMLTANQTAQAEGDYNIAVGKLHKEVADDLAENEEDEED